MLGGNDTDEHYNDLFFEPGDPNASLPDECLDMGMVDPSEWDPMWRSNLRTGMHDPTQDPCMVNLADDAE